MKSMGRMACCLLFVLLGTISAQGQSPPNDPHAQTKEVAAGAECIAAGLPEAACSDVSDNDEWTPLVREFDGVEMVLVPAGCFNMGNEVGFRGEQPVHEICFDQPFWIDRTEVTVAQFARFLNGQDEPVDDCSAWLDLWTVNEPSPIQLVQEDGTWAPLAGDANRPLESVTWAGAAAHCSWRGARLPGEAEWEYAARGPDGLLYPWGNEFVAANVVRIQRKPPEVGSKPQGASWIGALDMSSSLFEWVNSTYIPYPYDATDNREAGLDVDSASERVLRGGSWYHPDGMQDDVSATARFRALPHVAAWPYGFRCARSLDPGETAPAGAQPRNPTVEPTLPAAACLAAGLPEIACTGVPSNDEWSSVIREFDGIPMALVPAGCFTMGSTDAQVEYALALLDRPGYYEDEQPAHRQCFSEPFWIDVYEVTNGQYGSHGMWSGDDLPREFLSWFEADAYCKARGARLPTEAEWEYAARGPDSLLYPWGNEFDGTRLNYCDLNYVAASVQWADTRFDDGYLDSAPVGSYPEGASWVGALDMSGNLWEWVSSILLPYPYDPEDGREVNADQDSSSLRMVRGGGMGDPPYAVRAANRNERMPTDTTAAYGLRCARSLDSDVVVAEPEPQPALAAADCVAAGLPEIACTGISSNGEWAPMIREFDGIPMALVPAGCFTMGSTEEQIEYAMKALLDRQEYYENEQLAHQQCFIEPFWIDVYEVTNGQHGSFDVRRGDDLPREYISWFDSAAHCESRGARLPTEAEWEYAARGPDSWIYPWGDEFDESRLNYCDANCHEHPGADLSFDDGHELTAPVGSFATGVSWVGALDMSGNVWEWTSGILCDYPYAPDKCEVSPESDSVSLRTLRGGSWRDGDFAVRSANRNEHAPVDQTTIFGFRCVRSFSPADAD